MEVEAGIQLLMIALLVEAALETPQILMELQPIGKIIMHATNLVQHTIVQLNSNSLLVALAISNMGQVSNVLVDPLVKHQDQWAVVTMNLMPPLISVA